MVTSTAPTAAQVADAISGRYGAVTRRFRFTRHTRAGAYVDDVSTAVLKGSAQVELDNFRAVLRNLRVTIDLNKAPADFNPSSDVIRPAVEVWVDPVGQWASMPVGMFMLDVAEMQYPWGSPPGLPVPMQGADLTMLLVRARRPGPYTVVAGASYLSVLQSIVGAHGIAYAFPDIEALVPRTTTWPAGTTDWQIVEDLMWGINYWAPYCDNGGIVRTRHRGSLAAEAYSVAYRDDVEPLMLRRSQPFVVATDTKLGNRASILLDPAWGDGSIERENVDPDSPNSTLSLAYGTPVDIATSQPGYPGVIVTATPHGLGDKQPVLILGHAGSDPPFNGSYEVTVVSDTSFSIPVLIGTGGTGGTVRATTVQRQGLEFKGDSQPSTRAVLEDSTMAPEIALTELQIAAMRAQAIHFATMLDPRRDAHETYLLHRTGVEESDQVFTVLGWSYQLDTGAEMSHSVGRAIDIDTVSPPRNGAV